MKCMEEFEPVGHGHLVRLVYDGDTPVMLEEWHGARDGNGMCGHTIDISSDPQFSTYSDKDTWFFDLNTITVMPSITCTSCGEHGWLEFGVWYNDATHFSAPSDLRDALGLPPITSGLFSWVHGGASGQAHRRGPFARLRRYFSLR